MTTHHTPTVDVDVLELAGHALVAWAHQIIFEHANDDSWATDNDDPYVLAVDIADAIAATEQVCADARRWWHRASCPVALAGTCGQCNR